MLYYIKIHLLKILKKEIDLNIVNSKPWVILQFLPEKPITYTRFSISYSHVYTLYPERFETYF